MERMTPSRPSVQCTMDLLYSRHYPGPEGSIPVLILHGLFGSSRNWHTIAGRLSENHSVFALDTRNHGNSFHADEHSIESMSADLLHFIEKQIQTPVILLGHSMGGLVAMYFALKNPSLVKGLIVVDIAPRNYEIDYSREFDGMKNAGAERAVSRKEIEDAMADRISNPFVRQFLMMNLERSGENFRWVLNLPVLERERRNGIEFPEIDAVFPEPSLLIAGDNSPFFTKKDTDLFVSYFPKGTVLLIKDGDHWLHHTNQAEFLSAVIEFLETV